VTVDSLGSGNNRKITAFIGGLDLCDGRYDTPEHRLFRDLDTVFHNDFHNPSFQVSFYCKHCRIQKIKYQGNLTKCLYMHTFLFLSAWKNSKVL